MSQDRRRIPRLTLQDPLEATMSDTPVGLLDLSTGGALVEHDFIVNAGRSVKLRFSHEGQEVNLTCVVVRTRLGRSALKPGSFAYSSGLRFTDPSEPSRDIVRQIVAKMSRGR